MGTTLNRHVHQLTADHTSYNREMAKSARTTGDLAKSNQSLVSAIALIDGPLGGVASRASNLNSIFSKSGLIIGGVVTALSGFGFGMVKVLSVLSEAETEMTKINNLIRATGGSTGLLAEEFDSMARSVALDTLASTTDIRQAIGSLISFRSVGSDIFEKTIRLSQDMAAVWGGSAATNARKLGKAMEDPVKQLSRLETTVGAFDSISRDAILTMAKMGDKAGAQAKILETLELRIGGAANAFGLPGAKDTLAQRWDEFFEAVGNSTGVGKAATDMLNGLADALKNMADGLKPETAEDKIAELTLKRVKLMTNLADEQRKVNVLANQERMGIADENLLIQQRSVLEIRRNEIKILDNEIKKQQAIADLNKKKKDDEKEAARQKEIAFKAEQALVEKQLKDKEELEQLQKLIDEGSIIRFKALGKAAEDEIKARAKMQEEFDKLRDSGLTKIEKENELNQNNVVFLENYKKTFGETEKLKAAARAEEIRHKERIDELNIDRDMDSLTARLGPAANDEFSVDSLAKEQEQHLKRMEQLRLFGEDELANTQAIHKLIEEETERHEKAITEIKKSEEENIAKAKKDFWTNSISLMNSQSRKLFELGKIAAISNAVVSATESVPHAFNWGMKIGGPPLAGAFAAAAIAATATQIQAINNTQFGATSANSSSPTSVAEPFLPPTDSRKEVNFIFNGNISGMDADHIANMLKEHIDSTDFVLIEPSSRNGQELVA